MPKVYRATLRTPEALSGEAVAVLGNTGVQLPGKRRAVVKGRARNVPGEAGVVELEVTGGYNHQVKHMLALVGRPLRLLHRASFAGLELGDLECGSCRELTAEEVGRLYTSAGGEGGGGMGGGGGGVKGRGEGTGGNRDQYTVEFGVRGAQGGDGANSGRVGCVGAGGETKGEEREGGKVEGGIGGMSWVVSDDLGHVVGGFR